MTNRNIFRCVECGAGILTEAKYRDCYKCGSVMKFEGKEYEKENNI